MILKSAWAALTLVIAMTAGAMAQAVPQPDNQGWGGPGWYVSGGDSSLAVGPFAEPAWILFDGPHAQQSTCMDVYNRLYSPVGRCRLLQAKPGSFGS